MQAPGGAIMVVMNQNAVVPSVGVLNGPRTRRGIIQGGNVQLDGLRPRSSVTMVSQTDACGGAASKSIVPIADETRNN